MITERKFSVAYTSLWREITPSADNFVRHINLASERFVPPHKAASSSDLNGYINEAAFRLSREVWTDAASAPERIDSVRHIWSEVCRWLGEQPEGKLRFSTSVYHDVREVAARIASFLSGFRNNNVVFEPPFLGCGSISQCAGDMIINTMLVEIKAGDRGFRAVDLRQLFVYAALARAAGAPKIVKICLMNPRWGVSWQSTIDEAAIGCGAQSSAELLEDIVRNAVLLGVSR